MEVWKDVDGFQGVLQVSNLGRVRTLDHYVRHQREQYKKFVKGKIRKLMIGNSGYYYIMLTYNAKNYHLQVHRMVAKAFIPNEFNKPQVNHKNHNKLDNRVENLEWCTPSENMIHAYKNNLIPLNKIGHSGKSNPSARAVDAYTKDGEFIGHFDTMKDASKELGVAMSGVCNCCTGYSKTCHGMIFRYSDK